MAWWLILRKDLVQCEDPRTMAALEPGSLMMTDGHSEPG